MAIEELCNCVCGRRRDWGWGTTWQLATIKCSNPIIHYQNLVIPRAEISGLGEILPLPLPMWATNLWRHANEGVSVG